MNIEILKSLSKKFAVIVAGEDVAESNSLAYAKKRASKLGGEFINVAAEIAKSAKVKANLAEAANDLGNIVRKLTPRKP